MSGGVGYVVNGRYRLDRLIGRGGMGRVWGGHDANLDRVVAVKELMLPDDLPADERRELVERACARRASRPGCGTTGSSRSTTSSPTAGSRGSSWN
ncbi:hypothetical protein ACFXDE_04290 [Kitasatospora sp. NPDC059408]|uniref:hypothetical protein n=1 Tax=Kitasatospora sp. NPDC059408 TaxID=3346823 RepID=UPI0036B2C90D